MKLKLKPLVALLATGLVAAPLWAFDLAKAYEMALAQDSQIRGARAAAEAGRERLPQARAQLLPSVTLQVGRNRNQLETTAPNQFGQRQTTDESYTSRSDALTLRQPLYRKALWVQYQQAGSLVEATEADLAAATQNLLIRVTQAYFDVLLAQEQTEVIRQQKAAFAAQLESATRGLAAGAGTRTDIDEARSRLDLAVAQELELRQSVELARRRLQVMVNQPVDALASVDASRIAVTPPDPDSVDAWTQRAEETSPELRSLRAQLEASRQEVERAQAGHYPTLDANLQISRSASDNISRINSAYAQKQVGVQLTIPLYQGGLISSQVRQALARQEEAESQLEATRRDLGIRIHREYRGVSEGVLRVRALEQAVLSANALVNSNKRSFEAGIRTRVDILNAEQQLAVARRDLAEARYVYLASKVRLAALSGLPGPQAIAQISGALSLAAR